MESYRVVVIGGGITGTSVLYHLAARGWTDIALVERTELTAGSSWHAAGGFHAINNDPVVAALQSYTIEMYPKVAAESGVDIGLKLSGGIELASSPERMRWLRAEVAWHQMMGHEGARLMDVDEIVDLVPIVNPDGLAGGLFDPDEGNLDPNGAVYAYAGAARKRGATIITHNRVLGMKRTRDGWELETEKGPIQAEHVVNAAGMWGRKVGQMVGIDHPVTPILHHYLVTEDVPEIMAIDWAMPAVTDLEGWTYLQREQNGAVLGVYEANPNHWHPEGAPWDFGATLLPPDIDRIAEELTIGFARFPALEAAGIKRWVHGAFAITPDGNPLVGPVRGLPGYWAAAGVMAGYSQGAAVGLAISNWIIDGDPGDDVYAMDVTRFGDWAADDSYLLPTTYQFYARRFLTTYPHEQLPAGRPLHTTPAYEELKAAGAQFGVTWGLEVPQFYAPADFVHEPSLQRDNAFPYIAAEVEAVRTDVGAYETGVYSRYEVSGPNAAAWLDRLLAGRIPPVGRMGLTPMLHPKGTLMGDLSVTRIADDRFWVIGSYYLQEWHMRWFDEHMVDGVTIDNLSGKWLGFALSGPRSREIAEAVIGESLEGFRFMDARFFGDILVARMSLAGELGYELTVPADQQAALWRRLAELGVKPVGDRAIDSLRIEKGFGIWSTEFTQAYTPGETGLDRFIDWDKPDFIGRDAALAERAAGPKRRLVTLDLADSDADAVGDEPVWVGDRVVGVTTSGSYGHHVQSSLALALVDAEVVASGVPVEVSVIGERRPATVLTEPAYDPSGSRMR
ncbi:MAG: FAD-dependent oxidoreductase [Actinomycetales bacterium]|nr:FAD-dependent oxidoreductase [Actinomycetales bacterium]